MATQSQLMAQKAYPAVANRKKTLSEKAFKEYVSFAKKFPSLIHACGLAQALAFAEAKSEDDYLQDLANVVRAGGHADIESASILSKKSREESLAGYLRLSRNTLLAAGWLKRYAEALTDVSSSLER